MANNWRKIRRSVQLNPRQALTIRFYDTGHPIAIWVARVKIDVKLMHGGVVRLQLSSETQHGELFVCIVFLDNLSNSRQGELVLCWSFVVMVER